METAGILARTNGRIALEGIVREGVSATGLTAALLKSGRNQPSKAQSRLKRREHEKSPVRAKAEHVFVVVKRRIRYRKTRYQGLRKQTDKLKYCSLWQN